MHASCTSDNEESIKLLTQLRKMGRNVCPRLSHSTVSFDLICPCPSRRRRQGLTLSSPPWVATPLTTRIVTRGLPWQELLERADLVFANSVPVVVCKHTPKLNIPSVKTVASKVSNGSNVRLQHREERVCNPFHDNSSDVVSNRPP